MAGSRNKNEQLRIQLRQARGRKDRTKTPHLGLPKSLTDRDRREKLGEREFWRQEKISSKTKILPASRDLGALKNKQSGRRWFRTKMKNGR
jgi:hypothetical protein